MKFIFKIFLLSIFFTNTSNSNEIKWTNCKITEMPYLYNIMKPALKRLNVTYEDFLKQENDEIEFSEKIFNLNDKKKITRIKNKNEDLVENVLYFEFIDKKIAKGLGKSYEIKYPSTSETDEVRFFAVRVYTINFENNSVITHIYTGNYKDVFRIEKCKINIDSPSKQHNYIWIILFLALISYFVFKHSTTKKKIKKKN